MVAEATMQLKAVILTKCRLDAERFEMIFISESKVFHKSSWTQVHDPTIQVAQINCSRHLLDSGQQMRA